jgi:hypothetical protein
MIRMGVQLRHAWDERHGASCPDKRPGNLCMLAAQGHELEGIKRPAQLLFLTNRNGEEHQLSTTKK